MNARRHVAERPRGPAAGRNTSWLQEWVEAMAERRRVAAEVELQAWSQRDPDAVRDATELARQIGWGCPYHGLAEFKVSPRGRHYVGCAMDGCFAFHRDRHSDPADSVEPSEDDLPF